MDSRVDGAFQALEAWAAEHDATVEVTFTPRRTRRRSSHDPDVDGYVWDNEGG